MDNKRIEKKAVKAVENLFLDRSIKIDPNLATDDTGISFDGNAIIFSEEEITKASYLSSIPVQVKGKLVDEFSNKTAKFYKFEKNTFKNFLYEDGVVVFLAEILKSNPKEKKIFFTFLDAEFLETILKELCDKDKNRKAIELDAVTDNLDLDKEFREIAIQRKVYGFKDAKIDGFLKNKSTALFSNDYEKDIVEKASKHAEQYEYKNLDSQYNIKLKKDMQELLSQNLILDGFNLARVYGEIERLNLLSVLPESNLKLAILIKARYKAMIKDFESARSALEEGRNYPSELQKEHDKILIEANYDNKDIEILIANSVLNGNEKSKYMANYLLENNDLTHFYEILSENSFDDEWQYLHGQSLLLLQNYEDGIEVLSKLHQRHPMVSIQYEIIHTRFSHIENNLLFNFQEQTESDNNELLILLDDIEVIRQQVAKIENIEMPILEKLHFELKLLLNPKEGLEKIEDLINSEGNEYDVQYLIEWKIKVLYLLNENDKVLNFINELLETQMNHNVIRFKILTFTKQLAYKDSIEYISELFETLKFGDSKYLLNFLLSSYLIAITNHKPVDVKSFDSIITDLIKKYTIDLPLLFLIENTRKDIRSDEYGKSFSLIRENFSHYPDSRKIQTAQDFLYRNNELNFAKKLYPSIAAVNQEKADEILAVLYLMNNMNEEAFNTINQYGDSELTESMAIIKAEILNNLEQFSATVQLYKNKKLSNPEFLNQILIAKIHIDDGEDIKAITENTLESTNINFEINAAISLVHFGIDLPRGIQLIEKHILSERFNNSELNHILIGLNFSNIKKFENNNSIDLYNNIHLKWYKFKRDDSIREFVLIPEKWEIENYGNLEFYKTSSDFKLLVQGISIGDSVDFDSKKYSLIEEKPLFIFIFHEILKRESGAIGSDKFLTSINIDPENDGLGNLVEVMKTFDNSDKFKQVQEHYEQFHFPSIYGLIIPKDDILEFYLELFHDVSTKYYIGSEEEFNLNSNYLISVSSMTFLASLNLLDILKEYPNVLLEKTQKIWLESKFTKELESTRAGRLNLGNEGNLILNKKTKNQEKELKEIYRKMTLASRFLKSIDVDFIDEKLKELIKFDASSAQVAIDEKMILLYEDEAIQKILGSEFDIQISSVGVLISHYFLESEEDIDAFLNILIRVIELKSAWLLQRSTIERMHTLVIVSRDLAIVEKFNSWMKSYAEYFNIS
ncbi:hypothetical protein [Salinicoccus sp. CNSTN-B1]